MAHDVQCLGIGLACADVCIVLHWGTRGKKPGDVCRNVYEAMTHLTAWVKLAVYSLDSSLICAPYRRTMAEIQVGIERGERIDKNAIIQLPLERITLIPKWRSEINRILLVLYVRSDTCMTTTDSQLSEGAPDSCTSSRSRHSLS